MFLKWIVEALTNPMVLNAIGRIVEGVVKRLNDDQLARIRADLTHMEQRLSARIDGVEARVTANEARIAELLRARGGIPGPPPPLPHEGDGQ